MISTLDKVALEGTASLALKTGFDLGWTPDSATYLTGKGIEGWTGSAPIRRSKSEILSGHGTHAERGYKDERLITVNGHHVAANRAAAAAFVDDLNAYLGDGTEGIFRVDDVTLGSRWVEVYLAAGGVDVTWTGGVDVGFQVHMIAPDPRKYGAAVTTGPTGVPVPGTGLAYPLFGSPTTGALDIGFGGQSGQVTATNRGSADVGQVFIITANYAEQIVITETGSKRRLVYEGLVQFGQTLVLDSNQGTAALDGIPRDGELVVAEWVRLGRNESASWLFEAPGASAPQLTVKVTPAWW